MESCETGVCPCCGYCPRCGRRGPVGGPYQPYPYPINPFPFYEPHYGPLGGAVPMVPPLTPLNPSWTVNTTTTAGVN
jgi:hypothetical protein